MSLTIKEDFCLPTAYTVDTDTILKNYFKGVADTSHTTYASTKKQPHFSGYFQLEMPKGVYIVSVAYRNPATIVFWSDDTKTVCKCRKDDEYCEEAGLAMCILKKLIGATNVHTLFEDWIDYDRNLVTVKDVRAKRRNPASNENAIVKEYNDI